MTQQRRDHATIDINEGAGDALLASSIKDRMSNSSSMWTNKRCIFKVPNILRRHNEKAYVPNAFSIGPLHHGKSYILEGTEKIKLQYLDGFISRMQTTDKSFSLTKFITAIRKLEKDARECYAALVHFNVDEFIKILVVDGCFLIELLRKEYDKNLRDPDDPIFNMSCMLQFLYHDLILLENQIPWFVLECLFSMTMGQGSTSLAQLTINFFANYFSWTPLPDVIPGHGSKHILDLLRNALVSSSGKEQEELSGKWLQIPCAVSLIESGIKFSESTSKSILDIKFKDGVLEMPPLLIQETTEAIFRNLISFEQCYHDCPAKITSYAIVLDNLINTSKDMDSLCQSKVIDNWLNPDDATQFFNKLYHDTYIKEFHYMKLSKDVNEFCQLKWPRWRAVFVRNYFTKPWAIFSLAVAFILLVLAVLQTLFGIIK